MIRDAAKARTGFMVENQRRISLELAVGMVQFEVEEVVAGKEFAKM